MSKKQKAKAFKRLLKGIDAGDLDQVQATVAEHDHVVVHRMDDGRWAARS
jgi:hypothetical protein